LVFQRSIVAQAVESVIEAHDLEVPVSEMGGEVEDDVAARPVRRRGTEQTLSAAAV